MTPQTPQMKRYHLWLYSKLLWDGRRRGTWDDLWWQELGSWSMDSVSKQIEIFVSWEFVGHWINLPDSYEPALESFSSSIQAILRNGIQLVHLCCYPGTPNARYWSLMKHKTKSRPRQSFVPSPSKYPGRALCAFYPCNAPLDQTTLQKRTRH